jgi:hypothetical protein
VIIQNIADLEKPFLGVAVSERPRLSLCISIRWTRKEARECFPVLAVDASDDRDTLHSSVSLDYSSVVDRSSRLTSYRR